MPIELRASKLKIDLGGRLVKIKVIDDLEPLLARVENEDDIPFWAELWPSALGLARFLWQQAELKDKAVLELGAGLGLPGIAAALKGARVVETDLVAESLNWARENARLNGIFDIQYLTADWRDFKVPGKYEVILGSDILYEPKLHPMLENILDGYLLPGGRAYLADPGREVAGEFINSLNGKGWTVSESLVTVDKDNYSSRIRLYTINRRVTESQTGLHRPGTK